MAMHGDWTYQGYTETQIEAECDEQEARTYLAQQYGTVR